VGDIRGGTVPPARAAREAPLIKKTVACTQATVFSFLRFDVRLGFVDDKVLDHVVNLMIRLAENAIPLKRVHCAEQRLAVDRKVVSIGQDDLSVDLAGDSDKTVDLRHRVQSDTIFHLCVSFSFFYFFLRPFPNSRFNSGAKSVGAFQITIFIPASPLTIFLDFAKSICANAYLFSLF
jgi:hypothetical protein